MLFQRMRRERGSAEADLEDALGRDLRSSARSAGVARTRDAGGIVVEEKRPANDGPRVTPAPVAAAAPARAVESARKAATVEDTLSGDGPASMESGDPLAEADFHMAYGLYDQAADLVQLAMKREPKRRDLKLKLLEIYFVWGNKERFLQLAGEMKATSSEASAGEWDKILIMGKQIAPADAMFAGPARASEGALDLDLHGATGFHPQVDLLAVGTAAPLPDLDIGDAEASRADSSGIDFILDEPVRGADEDPNEDPNQGPTVETPLVRRGEDTAEVPVESLGLEVDSLRALESLDAPDTIVTKPPAKPKPTPVETGTGLVMVDADEDLDVDLDMLNSTALIKMSEGDTAQMLRPADDTMEEEGLIDLSESTGALPMLDSEELTQQQLRPSKVDYDLGGEPATMSEVGTKLDLARAYMDMGDPEGARSILDEVLEEGSATQRNEAERLIAALP
jgi:pilus assembly protein FimV